MIRQHKSVTVAGVTYPSPYKAAVALSLQTGIPEGTLRLRISRGYADKWILHPGRLFHRACTDHTGREFPTVKAMCKAWGIAYGTVAKRLERGVGLKTALTAQPMWTRRHEGRPVTDHTGREFRSVTAMCQAWKIDRRTWLGRITAGWSLERSLTEPPPPDPDAPEGSHREGVSHGGGDVRCLGADLPQGAGPAGHGLEPGAGADSPRPEMEQRWP